MINVVGIIPTSGSRAAFSSLKRCVSSLLSSAKNKVNLSIVLVTSEPDSLPGNIKKSTAKIVVVSQKSGFAEMNNAALRYSLANLKGDYQLLINDDAWVDKEFFSIFLKILSKNSADLIVPLVKEGRGNKLDSFGIEYFSSGFPKNAVNTRIATTLAPASCLLISTHLIKKLLKRDGYIFNPSLYFYIEDVEFSIRAISCGAKIFKDKGLKAYHIGSQTSLRESYFTYYYSFRNILWVIILTWPLSIIVRHAAKIIIVYGWLLLTTHFKGKRFIFSKITIDTIKNLRVLLNYRRKLLKKYPPNFHFEKIFSPYMFRTRRKGLPI